MSVALTLDAVGELDAEIRAAIAIDIAGKHLVAEAQFAGMVVEFVGPDEAEGLITFLAGIGVDLGQVGSCPGG